MKKNKEVATTKKAQNSSTAPVSQLPSLSEAFSSEFATIGFEEIKNDEFFVIFSLQGIR